MHVVSALKCILARVDKRVNCHIVFVPCEEHEGWQTKRSRNNIKRIKDTQDGNSKAAETGWSWKLWGQALGYVIGDRYVCDLPDDPWIRPAADSAMQPHTLLLPHSVGARFNHKFWGVHQAVFVHALEVFLVFMDLKKTKNNTESHQIETLRNVLLPFYNSSCSHRNPRCMHEAETKQHLFICFTHARYSLHLSVKHVLSVSVCCSVCPMNIWTCPGLGLSTKYDNTRGTLLPCVSRNTISWGICHPVLKIQYLAEWTQMNNSEGVTAFMILNEGLGTTTHNHPGT